MSATFTIKVNSIRTTNVNELTGVIKSVDFTVQGALEDKQFELPQTISLIDPQAESFKPLQQVTEADVIEWIETTDLTNVKSHIQYVLEKEVAKSKLQEVQLPWVTETTTQ